MYVIYPQGLDMDSLTRSVLKWNVRETTWNVDL